MQLPRNERTVAVRSTQPELATATQQVMLARQFDRAEFEREWIACAQRGYAAARQRARQKRVSKS